MAPIVLRAEHYALPWFLLAFTASSLAVLWPGPSTRWLLANRRYIGLTFAAGMAWHFSLVAYVFWSFGNPLSPFSTATDLTGAVFVLLLTVTSSQWAVRRLGAANWRRLHKTGVYVIWLLTTNIYYDNVKDGSDRFHYAVLSALLAAWLLRVAAWAKQRLKTQRTTTARAREVRQRPPAAGHELR